MENSFKKYCLELLKESDVTGVSSVITSKGWFRKLIKLLLVFCGVAGFVLQTRTFLHLYWEYSTTSFMRGMSEMDKPAITICDNNIFRRRYVCENTEWCLDFEEYEDRKKCGQICDDPNDIYTRELFTTLAFPDDIYDLNFTIASGFEIEKNLLQCAWLSNGTEGGSTSSFCGKPEFVRGFNKEKFPAACYTLKSSVDMFDKKLQHDTVLRMIIKWRTSDVVRESKHLLSGEVTIRSYWISFHHPGHASNPFLEGISVKEGRMYNIKVSQVDTLRLPPPFSTNCFDYEKQWKENQFKGPIGRQDCQAACEIDITAEEFGCVTLDIVYPNYKNLCMEYKPVDHDLRAKIQKCMEKCKDACRDTDYVADVKVSHFFDIQAALKDYGVPNIVTLDISFDVLKSVRIEYQAIYENVELLSYIGGYLGMWLGWSLLAVFDFFEIILNLCMCTISARNNIMK